MKSLVPIWSALLQDIGGEACISTTRDLETVARRVEHEGVSFLTITLPDFGKQFERCLQAGLVAPADFPGFKRKSNGPLPVFLGGFLAKVFNTRTGLLRDDVDPWIVYAVRQLTLLFGKVELETTEKRRFEAFKRYVVVDEEVKNHWAGMDRGTTDRLAAIAVGLFGSALHQMETDIDKYSLRPAHGPGVTAERQGGNARWHIKQWPERLESTFSYVDYALPSHRYYHDSESVSYPDPGNELPVRVVHVPKTLKTPRIIAIEPTCMQYMQQGIARRLVTYLESPILPSGRNAAFGLIGFTDQGPNRAMARSGSLNGDLATIDLKDASDRVSLGLVEACFERFPVFREAILACRSTTADVPGFGVIPLAKFASMGSALCFPVEAMVFLAVVFAGIQDVDNRPLAVLLRDYRGRVRVYGDDIIVPVDVVDSVTHALESYGLVVNHDKTFRSGSFRESCGGDYFAGEDVTPIRFRRPLPVSRGDAEEVVSLVKFRNLAYQRGLWSFTRYLDRLIDPLLNGHYPVIEDTSSMLGRLSFLPWQADKLSQDTQSPRNRGWVLRADSPIDVLDGWPALLKWFTLKGEEPLARDHLVRHGRSRAVKLKLSWRAPF